MRIDSVGHLEPTAKTEPPEDRELHSACQDFESLLVHQLISQMRKTVPKSNLFGNREKEEIFQDMLDDEVSRGIAGSGAMGLAEMLYAQLSSRQKKR